MDISRAPVELWDPTVAVLAAASSRSGCPLTTGLEQLVGLVGADRADGGYIDSPSSVYRPSVSVANAGVTPADFALPATDPIVHSIFATDHAIAVKDFAADVPDGPCRDTMLSIGTRAAIARRLDVDGRVFGLVCLDWVDDAHVVDEQLVGLIDQFVSTILAPVLAITSERRTGRRDQPLLDLLSRAEIAAVRLAARGLSYGEIAAALGKSANTIDHQLLRARRKLGARNTPQLLRMLATELDEDRQA